MTMGVMGGEGRRLGGLDYFPLLKYKLLEVIIDSRGLMPQSPNKMRQEKMDEDDRILEEYMRMKPSRAIDRLLSEYSIEKGFYLYNLLQQKIKRNTTQLRSTLTEKYENLVDCSNLLNKIKVFTDQIEAIQKNISQVFNQDPRLEEQDANRRKRSVVNIIEQRIYQKKYHVAMMMTLEHHENIDETDKMYLFMLRIQVISCLEEEIINRKFSKFFISEIIQCLKAFISHLSPKQKGQIINNERREGELLSLIAETVVQKETLESIVENDIIQIIFKCKLLSLHRKRHQQIKEEDNISKFFHDIFQLISEKQKDSEEISHLSAIFCKNLQQIEAHLLQTFIIKDKHKTISFRYELYQKLATSQDFIEILQKLYKVISGSYGDAPKTTLKESFMNLWENYYNQLIELLFQRCNPINFLPSLVTDQHKYPRQISKYICSDDLSIDSRIKSYQNQLQFFFTNINKLIKETNQLKSSKWNSHEIIEQILSLYASKIQHLNKLVADYTQDISIKPSLNKLGSLIFLFIFCDEFNTRLSALSQQKQLEQLKRIKLFELHSNYRITMRFYPCFYDQSQKQSKWSINFDHFFMKYYNPLLLKQSKRQLIKNIILTLLQGTMEGIDKDKTTIFLQQKNAKKWQQQKELQQKRNKLSDLPANEVKPTTFAKKKYAQQPESLRNGS